MVGRLGHHRAEYRQSVGLARNIWKQLRNLQSALPAGTKLPVAFSEQTHLSEKNVRLLLGLQGLAMKLLKLRFIVQRV